MKQLLNTILILMLSINLINAQKPEKMYSFAKVSKSHEYYIQQAELWWKEIEKNKSNEDAWYNYYRANRNCKGTYNGIRGFDGHKNDGWTKESSYLKELDEILILIENNIPNTFTYYRLKPDEHSSKEALINMKKAYQLEPENPAIYGSFVTYYEMNSNYSKRKEFNQKLYHVNDISSGFLVYNYNVLMSMKPNGIILTFGDNDTFPIWLLQDALNIRTDVTLLNIPLLSVPEYRTAILSKINIPSFSKIYEDGATSESQKEIVDHIIKNKPEDLPLYISTPVWKQFQEYESDLYIVGLVLEYSKENIDNIALLKNNFENKYALDYISNQFSYDISQELVERMNINYLPGIIKLYQHYNLSGEKEKAENIKQLGLLIADKGGSEWWSKAVEILK